MKRRILGEYVSPNLQDEVKQSKKITITEDILFQAIDIVLNTYIKNTLSEKFGIQSIEYENCKYSPRLLQDETIRRYNNEEVIYLEGLHLILKNGDNISMNKYMYDTTIDIYVKGRIIYCKTADEVTSHLQIEYTDYFEKDVEHVFKSIQTETNQPDKISDEKLSDAILKTIDEFINSANIELHNVDDTFQIDYEEKNRLIQELPDDIRRRSSMGINLNIDSSKFTSKKEKDIINRCANIYDFFDISHEGDYITQKDIDECKSLYNTLIQKLDQFIVNISDCLDMSDTQISEYIIDSLNDEFQDTISNKYLSEYYTNWDVTVFVNSKGSVQAELNKTSNLTYEGRPIVITILKDPSMLDVLELKSSSTGYERKLVGDACNKIRKALDRREKTA